MSGPLTVTPDRRASTALGAVLLLVVAWSIVGWIRGGLGSHPHAAPHAANVRSVGAHHVEAALEPDGRLRVYILGADDTELLPIPEASLPAEARLPGRETIPVRLTADPEPGEPPGMSSRFTGTLPREVAPSTPHLTVTVPLDGKRRRVHFSAEALALHGSDTHPQMPLPLTAAGDEPGAEERMLFATAAGLYTERDIRANGPETPSQRFRGIRPAHNPAPAPGAPLCPITNTEANEQFAWIIGGERYLFCCPPCIEEFVRRAKENPASIRRPEHYVQS